MLNKPIIRKKLSGNGLKFLEKYGFRNRIIKDKIVGVLNSAIKNKQS